MKWEIKYGVNLLHFETRISVDISSKFIMTRDLGFTKIFMLILIYDATLADIIPISLQSAKWQYSHFIEININYVQITPTTPR